MAHNYRRSFSALMNVREVGYEIALGQMLKSIGPMVFVFLGTGDASKGAQQEIFENLPFEYIEVKDLPQIHERGSMSKVYGVVIGTKDYLRKKDGGDFNREEFRQHPGRYVSVFAEEVAPYASVIVNGLYWKPGYPKLLTTSDAQKLLQARPKTISDSHLGFDLPHRLLAICEISADPCGAFEFIDKCTTFPFFIYDENQQQRDVAYRGPGILICSIDNMPSQFAMEATESFGKLLLPYMDNILSSDATKPLEQHNLHKFIREAIIASNGKLQPNFEYIDHYIKGLQK
ncbi:hypothetical protein JTE90_024645 [Oedothorax gibbosus]|uniref:Alanine dehydrogenase/pyridine nucleotide transhydrogenase NAD(H)-binding domain-containing protein n=1 Tax=Oedothorax gibbosus TaxID=931172 RepID=A0AAV6U2P9_9ARAC|nr:hypothetical protein JTE90_024645 [Oedothorax gibbosus]